MSNAIENTRFIMCNALNQIRKAKKHPRLLEIFENAMEAHLEALRVERERDVMASAELIEYRAVLRDAYDRQKQLTQSACISYRQLEDEYREVRTDKQHLENANEHGYAKLQEATAKLAQQAKTIIALHRVVKDQQASQDRLQRGMDEALAICNRDKARFSDERAQSLEAFDETLARCEAKQELIFSQRKVIESLTFELASARKQAQKRSFWGFLMPKKNQAKPLPKKMN